MRAPRGYQPQLALAEITKVKDDGKQQVVDHHGFAGEQHSEVYRMQFHGVASNPPKGSTALVLSLGGERSRSVIFGGEHDDHRRKNLKDEESKFYGHGSAEVHFSEGGLVIDAGKDEKPIPIKVGETTITAHKDKAIVDVGGMRLIVTKDRVDIGGEGGSPVMTAAGPSTKVFAV